VLFSSNYADIIRLSVSMLFLGAKKTASLSDADTLTL